MTNIKIVIGANFGDEGKGLMTDYFAKQTFVKNKKCLNICHNGGCQRSHTVTTPSNITHAFQHFGSGSFFKNVDTYFSKDYILNPIFFKKEWLRLKELGIIPNCYANENCIITTPFDMLINQIIESSRNADKHGSCGVGIYETVYRNKDLMAPYSFTLKNVIRDVLFEIKNKWLPARLLELNIEKIDTNFLDIINNPNLLLNYIDDLNFMLSKINIVTDDILYGYSEIIFESGQGLLLDQNNVEYLPHLTPSNTGIKNPVDIINALYNYDSCQIEACYVTRTYLTRHGAGRFDTECDKNEINPNMIDNTNITNIHQGKLRYGYIDSMELYERIKKDYQYNINPNSEMSIVITHLNETNNMFIEKTGFTKIDTIKYKTYTSNGQDRTSIKNCF